MITEDNVRMPKRATTQSAGYDFYAPHDIKLLPGEWTTVDTGVKFDGTEAVLCPISKMAFDGEVRFVESTCDTARQWAMLIIPRSSYGFNYGLRLRNSVGLIDMDYRHTIKASLTVDEPLVIRKGDRFLQGIIVPFGIFRGEETPASERKGGIGSTGA